MSLNEKRRESAWVILAQLFFLDTESSDRDFSEAARSLKELGVNRTDAERLLIDEVAPVAGANLGFFLVPVTAGVWNGFDKEDLCRQIREYLVKRSSRPRWLCLPFEWIVRRMIRKLETERLWRLMETRELP